MSKKDTDGTGEPTDGQMAATGASRKPKRQRPPSERGAHRYHPLLEASEAA